MPRIFLQVDPARLRLPGSRTTGADPNKLARQIAAFGDSIMGMPPILVTQGMNDELQIMDGVTRATRAAKLKPGELVTVEIIDVRPHRDLSKFPLVGDRLP